VYIWARPADAKATVKSVIVASEADAATAEFNGGQTAELKVGTGETKYVAFKITAQDRTEEVYIVKLYREKSSDVRINSFGTSGIAAPVAVADQDYDYEVTINTSSYSYIWARPEYAQATVRSAVADSIDAAKAALADGKTVQIDRMTEIGAEKYVAFEITAQNGDKATYIVKVTRQ
ncbi:MAG: hypothetical protein IKL09_03060, partial [Clostridia bacterium]|nr:hypothetical protein [Clostridia bacterium]